MYYSYNFVVNHDNLCYSYVVIGSSFVVCCYSLNFCSVSYRVIYFVNYYILIYCLNNRVIDYFDIFVSIPFIGIISISIILRVSRSIIGTVSFPRV